MCVFGRVDISHPRGMRGSEDANLIFTPKTNMSRRHPVPNLNISRMDHLDHLGSGRWIDFWWFLWFPIRAWSFDLNSPPGWRSVLNLRSWVILLEDLPSGKLVCYWKSPFWMGKPTISMAIFNSYVSLPEDFSVLHHSKAEHMDGWYALIFWLGGELMMSFDHQSISIHIKSSQKKCLSVW